MTKGAYAYILCCADGTYYTGWTSDLDRRLEMHNSGRGAAYTRARRPVRLAYAERLPSRSAAMRREQRIKRLGHQGKAQLIDAVRAEADEAKGG